MIHLFHNYSWKLEDGQMINGYGLGYDSVVQVGTCNGCGKIKVTAINQS